MLVSPKGFEFEEDCVYMVGFMKPKKVCGNLEMNKKKLCFACTITNVSNWPILNCSWVKLEYATNMEPEVSMPNEPKKWCLINIHHFKPSYNHTLSPFSVLYCT